MDSVSEIEFERRDLEIFKITDTKTRLLTLQKYFFPRLEMLLQETLQIISDIYEVDVFGEVSLVRRPSPRAKASYHLDYQEVYVGISGKQRALPSSGPLLAGAKPQYSPAALKFVLSQEEAGMFVIFNMCQFWNRWTPAFRRSVTESFRSHRQLIQPIFSLNHLSYPASKSLLALERALEPEAVEEFGFDVFSPTYYLPLDQDHGLWNLQLAFISLFPLYDTTVRIAQGLPDRSYNLLEKFRAWYLAIDQDDDQDEEPESGSPEEISLPELDDYNYVRARQWWQVLARDNWTCCSCGRSSSVDGVVLHVDHIVPRSRGGKDCMENFQTLCHKCNIGKSNLDATDLRKVV